MAFVMLHRALQPSYDHLLERKLSCICWEIKASPLGPDLESFVPAAAELGLTERVRLIGHRPAGTGPVADPDRARTGAAHGSRFGRVPARLPGTVSGRAVIDALVDGERRGAALAELARGRMRAKSPI